MNRQVIWDVAHLRFWIPQLIDSLEFQSLKIQAHFKAVLLKKTFLVQNRISSFLFKLWRFVHITGISFRSLNLDHYWLYTLPKPLCNLSYKLIFLDSHIFPYQGKFCSVIFLPSLFSTFYSFEHLSSFRIHLKKDSIVLKGIDNPVQICIPQLKGTRKSKEFWSKSNLIIFHSALVIFQKVQYSEYFFWIPLALFHSQSKVNQMSLVYELFAEVEWLEADERVSLPVSQNYFIFANFEWKALNNHYSLKEYKNFWTQTRFQHFEKNFKVLDFFLLLIVSSILIKTLPLFFLTQATLLFTFFLFEFATKFKFLLPLKVSFALIPPLLFFWWVIVFLAPIALFLFKELQLFFSFIPALHLVIFIVVLIATFLLILLFIHQVSSQVACFANQRAIVSFVSRGNINASTQFLMPVILPFSCLRISFQENLTKHSFLGLE